MSFDPTTISSLKCWIKADSLTQADGATVDYWPDLSGNANDFNTAGTDPTFKGNVLFGLPGVLFDGSSTRLINGALDTMLDPDVGTVFVVCRPLAVSANNSTIKDNDCVLVDMTNYNFGMYFKSVPWCVCAANDGSEIYTEQAVVSWPETVIMTWVHDSGYLKNYLYGVLGGNEALNTIPDITGQLAMGYNANGYYFNGYVFEVLIFNDVLSEADFTAVEEYLEAKWIDGTSGVSAISSNPTDTQDISNIDPSAPILSSWKYKTYIQNDDGDWIDFSASSDGDGSVDALLKVGDITVEYEKDIIDNVFTTGLTDIVLDNSDKWLDGPDWTPRFQKQISGGIRFTQDSEYGYVPHNTNLIANSFTLGCWIYIEALNTDESVNVIIAKHDSGTNGYRLVIDNSANISFSIYKSGSIATATFGSTLSLNTWYHVVCICSYSAPNTTASIYVNSIIGTQQNFSGNITTTTEPLAFGYHSPTGLYNFRGKIDEAFFTTSVWSLTDVTNDYNYGQGTLHTSILNATGLWHFDENGVTFNDYSGSNNNGTITDLGMRSDGKFSSDNSQFPYSTFKTSKGKKVKVWKNRKVKIAIQSNYNDGTSDEFELGVFFIKSTKNQDNKKILSLETISGKLDRRKADVITNAGSWYQNASYRFIIEKLLKTELKEDRTSTGIDRRWTQSLPSSFILPRTVEKPTIETSQQRQGKIPITLDTRALSLLGRPPEWQGNSDAGNFLNSGGFCTSLYLWKYNQGTISASTTTGDNVLVGNNTDWLSPGDLRPTAGDCIQIFDDRYGNQGFYEIKSVDSDLQITLTTPLKGVISSDRKNTTSLGYVITRIYMGISYHGLKSSAIAELWKYSPGLETYTKLYTWASGTPFNSGAIYKISTYRTSTATTEPHDGLQCVGFNDLLNFTNYSADIFDRRCHYGARYVFTITNGEVSGLGSTNTLVKTLSAHPYYPITGFFHFRHGDYTKFGNFNTRTYYHEGIPNPGEMGHPGFHRLIIGQGRWPVAYVALSGGGFTQGVTEECAYGGESITIPFPQTIQEMNLIYNYTNGALWFNYEKMANWVIGSSTTPITQDNWPSTYNTQDYVLEYGNSNIRSLITGASASDETVKNLIQRYVGSGFYRIWLDDLYDNSNNRDYGGRLALKYSSNQKGAFAFHTGDPSSGFSEAKTGGLFYFIPSYRSDDSTAYDFYGLSDSKYRLITPTFTGTDSTDILDTTYFFGRGVMIANASDTYEDNFCKVLQPTNLEVYQGGSGKNNLIISFIKFDDSIQIGESSGGSPNVSNSAAVTYPYTDSTNSYVYRVDWRYEAINATLDTQTSFLGTSPTTTTTVNWNPSTGTSLNVTSATNIRVGDIIRIDTTTTLAKVAYARVTNISSNTLTLSDSNGSTTVASEFSNSAVFAVGAKVNVVARMIFTTDGASSPYDNLTPLETKTFLTSSSALTTYISFLNRPKVGTLKQYMIGFVDANSTASTVTYPIYHQNQPEGLIATVNEQQSNTYPYLLYLCAGILYRRDTASAIPTIKGNGMRADEGEVWLNSNTVLDSSTRNYSATYGYNSSYYQSTDILYGISAPTPPHYTQEAPQFGLYNLFKYDTHFAIRVPLCDFKDKTVWEVLKLLAQKADYMMGFAGEDFWFVPRFYISNKKDTSDLSLSYNEDTSEAKILEISEEDFSEDEIINVCKITPYRIKLNEPEMTFTFKPRATVSTTGQIEEAYDPNVQITVNQRDNLKKNIKLCCVRGGFISQAALGNNGQPVLWRYLVTEPTWESSIYAYTTPSLITSNGYIYLSEGAEKVRPGDVIEIRITIDEVIYIGTYTVTKLTAYPETSVGKVYVVTNSDWSPSTPAEVPVNTPVIIRPNNKWSDYNFSYFQNGDFEQWSDYSNNNPQAPDDWTLANNAEVEMVTRDPYLGSRYARIKKGQLTQSTSITAGVVYRFSVYMKGTGYISFSSSGGSLTTSIDPGCHGGSFTDPLNANDGKWREVRGTVTNTTSATLTVTFTKYTYTDSRSFPLDVDSFIFTSGYTVNRDYFSVGQHDKFYEIAHSKVFLKFTDENQNNYDFNSNQETRFLAGDIIDIVCKGLELEQDTSSVQVYRDETSINRYGINEKTIDNPYLTYKEARDLCAYVVENFKDPRSTATLRMVMTPGISFINKQKRRPLMRIDIRSEYHFPFEPAGTFRGSVKSLKYSKNISIALRNLLDM